jgi:hypothetical protein
VRGLGHTPTPPHPHTPTPTRWVVLVLAALALLAPRAPASAQPGAPLGVVWTQRNPGTVALRVSGDGTRVFAATDHGDLRCFDQNGEILWTERLPGIDRLECSRDGSLLAAYAYRRPSLLRVVLFDATGSRIAAMETPGPVRSVVVAPDGRYVIAAAGHTLTYWRPVPKKGLARLVTLAGEILQLRPGPGETVHALLRDPVRLLLVRGTGKIQWKREYRNAAGATIAASPDGRLLAIGLDLPRDPDGVRVSLVDAQGRTRWSISREGRAARVLTASAEAVLLSFDLRSQRARGTQTRFENRLECLGPSGGRVWIKGGAYTAPLFAAADPGANWVVALDTQHDRTTSNFRLFGPDGLRRWVYTAPANLLAVSGSPDGRHVVTYRDDGMIELLRVETGDTK